MSKIGASQLIFDKGAKRKQWEMYSQNMVLRKLDIHMQQNESRPLFLITYRNQLEMD
jgi:hypothetical protein